MGEQTVPADPDDDAGQRGTLTIRDRVVHTLAARAALDVDGVVRHSSGLDKVTGHDLPRVDTTIAGGHVRAAVAIAVLWPRPLPSIASRVRSQVSDTLSELTGLDVESVGVSIDAIVSRTETDEPARGRVQ